MKKATTPGKSSGTPTSGPAVATAQAGLSDRSADTARLEYEAIGRRRELLFKQLRLLPAPSSCSRHGGQALSELTCVKCKTCPGGLCLECIKQHAAAYPEHNLSSVAADVRELREQFRNAASTTCESPAAVSYLNAKLYECRPRSHCHLFIFSWQACSVLSAVLSRSLPLAECARAKALHIEAALDTLSKQAEEALEKLTANRDSAIAALTDRFKSLEQTLLAEVAEHRRVLVDDLKCADDASKAAQSVCTMLVEVRE